VFGASDAREKFGGRVMQYLVRHRFPGCLVPINPGRDRVLGHRCYPDVASAPGPIDVALLAVPANVLESVIDQCGRAGVGFCILPTTGLAESGGAEGAAAQARLVDAARRAGVRLVGPNCLGLINPRHQLALNASTVMDGSELVPGHIGLISQSGALMVSMYDRAAGMGIGFSACVSVGNQADLEVSDFLEYMVGDRETRAICVYVEGVKNPPRFLRALDAAWRARKPVVMYKVGRTAAGVRASKTHTATLAGDFAVFEAAVRERGVILTDDPHDGMVQAADLFVRWGPPRGDGIGVVAPSGGGMSITADRLSENGLRLAALHPSTKARLRTLLHPPQADNPVDLGGRLSPDLHEGYGGTVAALAADPDVSATLIMLSAMPSLGEATRILAQRALDSGKPAVAIIMPAAAGERAREALRELRCPFSDHLDDAIRMLRIWTAYWRALERPPGGPPARPALPDGAERAAREAPAGPLSEPEAKALLAAYDIPVNTGRLATTKEAAAAAADAIGYPVALKAVSRQVVHKTEAAAVRLALTDAAAVRTAFDEVITAVRRYDPSAAVDGCLVQAMAVGEVELLVGVRRDPDFGPVVVVASGGVLAEILGDVRVSPAPVSTTRALELLRGLRVWPVLAGVRGRPPLDVARAAEIVSRMSWLAADLGGRLIDLEANPVLVGPAGGGAVVVDARGALTPGALGGVSNGRGFARRPHR
jgi:acetyl-CoA synthetase (ADP-forming)